MAALELGCGDGRDAVEIANRVSLYRGLDYSKELINIARARNLHNAIFEVADMRSLDFKQYGSPDVIFAFASLLHLDKKQIKQLFINSASILNDGGLWYVSLKYSEAYTSDIKKDAYGTRLFYLYHPDEIKELAGERFKEVYRDFQDIGETKWFTIALKKA